MSYAAKLDAAMRAKCEAEEAERARLAAIEAREAWERWRYQYYGPPLQDPLGDAPLIDHE